MSTSRKSISFYKFVHLFILTGFSLLTRSVFSSAYVTQSAPEFMLEIYSTGLNISEKTLGHAFMSIRIRTNNGYKEEPFGFYSEPEARGGKDIPRLVVGMPGALRKEFDRNPQRFSKIEETLQVPITDEQRRRIYNVVQDWDAHHYELLTDNCITFVGKVAEQAGIPLPNRILHPTANQYVAALRDNYKLEQKRIEAEELERQRQEQVRQEAERRRQREEQARQEAERLKQQQARQEAARRRQEQQRAAEAAAAAAEAQRIPAGWVPCSCPALHARFGKYVNGVLYHPTNVRCP
jgi:hypothetical protein